MKKTKRLFAMILAMMMAVVLAIPAFAADSPTYTITISNSTSGHTYSAYQVFGGDLPEDGVLSNIEWGDGVNGGNLLTALKADQTIGSKFTSSETAADVAKVVAGFGDNSTDLDAFAAVVGNNLSSTNKKESVYNTNNYTISNLSAGYYLVKDSATVTGYDAQTKFILKLVANTTVTPKSEKPTVDKQVQDETADAEAGHTEGWGETADHAINESFKFKLVATIPNAPNMNAYKYYYMQFVDSWSEGITFEQIDSVTVNDTTLNPGDYTLTPANPSTGTNMTIAIQNIIPYLGRGKTLAGSTVTVIYSAHLNEKAAVNTASGSTANENTVKLKFSNNPTWNGQGEPETGETPEDTVWVFTYQVNNTKKDGGTSQPLSGAGFKLYTDSNCSQEVALIYDQGKGAYRPVKIGETKEEMRSAATTGKFDIIGLDAGTYYLKETTVPSGYNEMSPNPMTITISATHSETYPTTANVTLDGTSTMQNEIKNYKGSPLPSTGGMGTTIFYILGGVLVAGAGVLLITKKRMDSGDDQ